MVRWHKLVNLPRFLLFAVATAFLFSAGSAKAVEKPFQDEEILHSAYHRIKTRLEGKPFGLPLYLESFDQDGRLRVDVYGIVDYPFESVLSAFRVPSNWCDIACLHPNIKACTYRRLPDAWLLTFYSGRKFYQPPEDTHQFIYRYRSVEERQGYLNILLSAEEGPYGTKEHRMRVEALRIEGRKTLVHVSYGCCHGFSLQLAEKIYFATLGHGKVGFTVDGTDDNGNPVYVGGPRGAIERSAVRYYLAIKAFMDALRYPEEGRFSIMISEWYDLTSRYHKQLYEMDKKDYLLFKTEEHKNQTMLQRRLSMNME